MKKYLFALLAGAVALASCNELEEPYCPTCGQVEEAKPDNVLVIHPFIEGKNSMQRNWQDGNTLGLWLTEGDLGHPYCGDTLSYSNVRAKHYSDTWFFRRDVLLTGDPAVVYACHPYIQDVDPTSVPVECMTGTDYLYGTHVSNQAHVRDGHNEAILLMKHALSLVQVYIKKRADVPPIKVDRIEIRPVGAPRLPIAGRLNIQSGVLTASEFGKYSQRVADWSLGDEFTAEGRRDLPVIPQQIRSGQVELAVTIGGVEYTRVLQSNTWERAYRYVYRIQFTGEELEIVNVEIKPWETIGDIIIDIVGQ